MKEILKVEVNENPEEKSNTIKSAYDKQVPNRSSFIKRAEECATVTLPFLFPKEGMASGADIPTPRQGLGARAVNNLASKCLLALLPPNAPFFKFTLDETVKKRIIGASGAKPSLIEEALGKMERAEQEWIESSGARVPAFLAIKLLIVTGNILLYTPDEGGMKAFKLNQYVCKRDPMGTPVEIILKEVVHYSTLNKDVQALVEKPKSGTNGTVEVYTLVTRLKGSGKEWAVEQEINENIIPTSRGIYPLEDCPFVPLRWVALEGEDYGRGHAEEYLGDLNSLESLTESIVIGSAAAAKVLFLTNPNGVTSPKDLSKAKSGDFVKGINADITTLQLDKFNDFKVALETIATITKRIEQAFLLNSAIQRNGERVTAEEIRFMASELEDTLGGVYSVLSKEMQLPMVKRFMSQMIKAGKFPAILKEEIKPIITTGLEALGRGHELAKWDAFLQRASTLGEAALGRLDIADALLGIATGLGLAVKIKSDEELAEEQTQAQNMALLKEAAVKSAPNLVKGVADAQKTQQETG